jgi:DNA-directed RNA polymerase subunit M/transcription elongation factor TFIIS
MDCPNCGAPMVIDTWYGWRWSCFNCDYIDRAATDEEVEKQEKEVEWYLKNQRNSKYGK